MPGNISDPRTAGIAVREARGVGVQVPRHKGMACEDGEKQLLGGGGASLAGFARDASGIEPSLGVHPRDRYRTSPSSAVHDRI